MSNNIKWKRELQIGLVVGLIFLVLSRVLFEPVLQLLGDFILWIGGTSLNVFIDFVFKNAAQGFREQPSTIMLYFFLCTLLIPVNLVFLALILISIQKFFPLAETLSKVDENINKNTWIVLGIATSLAIYLTMVATISENCLEMLFISKFEQHITILSPKITEQEVKELRAQWALMKNFDDYVAINKKVKDLASAKHISLP